MVVLVVLRGVGENEKRKGHAWCTMSDLLPLNFFLLVWMEMGGACGKLDSPLGTYYQLYWYAIFHLPLFWRGNYVKGVTISHLGLLCVHGNT